MQLAITFALFKLLSPGFSPFYLYECWSDFLKRMGLVTDANDLGDGRFYDPRTRQSFK